MALQKNGQPFIPVVISISFIGEQLSSSKEEPCLNALSRE